MGRAVLGPGVSGDESLAAYAALYGGPDDLCRLDLDRSEELAFAYGYCLGRGDEPKADEALRQMSALPA